jgi:nitrogen regulatory protein PII
MKLIVAMIRPETLLAVQEALSETEARLMSVGEVSDLRRPQANVYRGAQYRTSRVRLRLEIVVEDQTLVDETVEAIARGAGSGSLGPWGGEDVFVMNLDDYRSAPSRTGEYALHR